MNEEVNDLIGYRISKSKECFEEALLLAQYEHWNTVANRLYYSCYYLVNALLIKNEIVASSHNGVKTQFHNSFVKKGKVSLESGKLFNRVFNLRQEGDYIDFQKFKREEIEPFILAVSEFISEIERIINE